MMGGAAADLLRMLPVGSRVVVRHALGDGATDALGQLLAISDTGCTVETIRGPRQIEFTDVIAAKEVPPAPIPRGRRRTQD